jgi:sugar lactone lactonase YvrE
MDTIATGVPAIYGLRYLDNGLLVAASYTDGRVIELSTGVVVDYVTDIDGINGVQPDFEGRVWATNFSQVLLIDDTPMATPVVDPAPSANGIVYDPDRARIFFTDYGDGTVNQADVDKMGNVGTATMLVDLGATTSPDGMALDECGNLYVVDQGGNMIYRVFLDADANVVGLPEELLADTTPTNIANAQFGVGAGFDATTLYAIGTPGVLYAVEVGVAGAPVPVP